MQTHNPFTIYNASAGSGKTFTLVKAYLKLLFDSNNLYLFKNILAITFTNKAVAEMKGRIIEMLQAFSDKAILDKPIPMFTVIAQELKMEPETLQKKAYDLLNIIVHNYAAFDISTIDGFTHKLIRTFAHDLKQPLNFEVELDKDSLLNQAVDSLIAKAGTDDELTSVLVDFAIEKADDDKSWDVSFDFNKVAKLLVNENDIPFIETLKDKTLQDFKKLKSQLKKEILTIENTITNLAKKVLNLIEEAGLEHNDFSGSYLPRYFQKLAMQSFDINFDAKWQKDIETATLYPKRVSDDVASVINQIQPQLAAAFNNCKKAIFQLKFSQNIYKNITPLSVLNAINNELKALKDEQNKMLISEFNTIISQAIKKQPTPFIYERIGEKFNHYFIDEFQDTSVLQWVNLMPLIENSLATQTGSAMLVGDAKQAIYRWRGGKAEQFINLFNKSNKPFPFIKQQVEQLPDNYRSFKEIVDFNNTFFKFLANQVFSNEDYKNLYEDAKQNNIHTENGYVELSFLDIDTEEDANQLYSEQVLNTINSICLKEGYRYDDICVLVRKKKEGIAIANYLSQHEIPIMSSETLLINNAPEVVFVNNIMALLIQPKNTEVKIACLQFLATFFKIEDKHEFFTTHVNLSLPNLFKSFEQFNVFFSSINSLKLPLYDLAETIVRSFHLVEKSNAYIQFYLDAVLDFSQQKGSDISGFLDYFNKKKNSLSIISPKEQNAVQIMTIHKSKGLEFPVVIFPYANLNIYKELEPKEWYRLEAETYAGFSHTLLNYNIEFENYGENGKEIHTKHQSELELDNINLLYVALTRAVEQLYIISEKDITSKGEVNTKTYSGLLITYLQHIEVWHDSKLKYHFGTQKRVIKSSKPSKKAIIQEQFISNPKESQNIKIVTKSGLLWDTNQQEAIEKGNLIHDILAQIKTIDDIDFVVNDFLSTSFINTEQASILKPIIYEIVTHKVIKDYYNSKYTIYNERDIILKNGVVLRPDRLVVQGNEVVIIDYKTGNEDKNHEQQLQLYQDALETMNFKIIKKILIYINQDIKIKDL